MSLYKEAMSILHNAIHESLPTTAVQKAMQKIEMPTGKVIVVAIGKAGWEMAKAAASVLGERVHAGIVLTKYDHSQGAIGNFEICEAGHPVPDRQSYASTEKVLALTEHLSENDLVLFLVSGGGSALFEKPLLPENEMADITKQLLASGADIVEMNTLRKRFSAVKGGRFGQWCQPAKMVSIILSDIIGDPLDMIASGPAYPDSTTAADALAIVQKYKLSLSEKAQTLLQQETPKTLTGITSMVTGSVTQLCMAAKEACVQLGYQTTILSTSLCCQAKEAGSFLASMAQYHQNTEQSLAFIIGGETVVQLTGKGMGGRNQELALSAAQGISGLTDTCLFSVGSDGTDGPTDAAGGYVTGETKEMLAKKGITIFDVLQNNDAYHALQQVENGLIITGATGTNVNDVAVLLIKR